MKEGNNACSSRESGVRLIVLAGFHNGESKIK